MAQSHIVRTTYTEGAARVVIHLGEPPYKHLGEVPVPTTQKRKKYYGKQSQKSSSAPKKNVTSASFSSPEHAECDTDVGDNAPSGGTCSPHDPHGKTQKILVPLHDENTDYIYHLTHNSGITPLPVLGDSFRQAFILQDWHSQKLVDTFFLCTRRPVVQGKAPTVWLYGCSCNPPRFSLVCSLSRTVDDDLPDVFGGMYEECQHISALKDILAAHDCLNGVTPDSALDQVEGSTSLLEDHLYSQKGKEKDIFRIEGHDTFFFVWNDTSCRKYGIVFLLKTREWKCQTCKTTDCYHTRRIREEAKDCDSDIADELHNAMRAEWKRTPTYVPCATSSKPIPMCPSLEQQSQNCVSMEQHLRRQDGAYILSPKICKCGENLPEPHASEQKHQTQLVFTSTNIIQAKVFFQTCGACGESSFYDGSDDGLLNMGSFLMAHHVLRDYLHQFVTEGTTMAAFYKEWCWRQVENGHRLFCDQLSQAQFRYSWYEFTELLDINTGRGFTCPDCGDYPSTVVMDGISLGLRKDYFVDWVNLCCSLKDTKQLDGSSHNMRVFVASQQTRKLLGLHAKNNITEKDYMQLLDMLGTYCQPLKQLLLEIGDRACPPVLQPLLKNLAKNSPVCSIIPNTSAITTLLKEMAAGYNPAANVIEMKLLQEECPLVYDLFTNVGELSAGIRGILHTMLEKAKAPFLNREIHRLGPPMNTTAAAVFPSMPQLCERGNYVLDNKVKSKPNSSCSKKSTGHPTLTPGLFTLACPHGVCYGFQLMEDAESPNVPFTIIRTRFPHAPQLVIYDNACQLHSYCLNRDPAFFERCAFKVDRFHWKNHSGCNDGYNLSKYPQHHGVNTQVAEQRNSKLRRLKPMLSYMNVSNFMKMCRLFTWFHNMFGIVTMEVSPECTDMSLYTFFKDLARVYSTKLK